MADYDIQMKQFNGVDYDNLYPYTKASIVHYDSNGSLTSTTIQDALTELNATRPYVIKGSYVGTGVYGIGSPNTLVFDREVSFVAVVDSNSNSTSYDQQVRYIWLGQSKDRNRTYSYANKSLSWYGSDAATQLNTSGTTYLYFAIAEETYTPYIGQSFILLNSGSFVVPVTGKYRIEIHGGGGGNGGDFGHWSWQYRRNIRVTLGGAGGGSGEVYNNVQLTAGDIIPYTIGKGGTNGSEGSNRYEPSTPATDGTQGGTTTFGSYSIAGGMYGTAATLTVKGTGGVGSGSIATAGSFSEDGNSKRVGSGGSEFGNYGNGGGVDGAVIVTYLGV